MVRHGVVGASGCTEHQTSNVQVYQDVLWHCADSQGGLRLLEWTGSLVPQGVLVKGPAVWHALCQFVHVEQAQSSRSGHSAC